MHTRQAILLSVAVLVSVPAMGATNGHNHTSPYASEHGREITGLSAADIEELEAGQGWGLAKAAELNGLPGPRHLLDMRDDLGLSDAQVTDIERIFADMRGLAVELGQHLIERERALDTLFRSGIPEADELQMLLQEIGSTRAALRYVHLSAHLKTPEILSSEQLQQYNQLRGYEGADPCAQVPEGHDPQRWKLHNGCN